MLKVTDDHKLPCKKMNSVDTKMEINVCIQEYICVMSHHN